jgi:hypothetical protein
MLAHALNYAAGNQKQKDSIVEQLDRLLAHPVFKNSKRCPIFLRHVVERTLQGETDHPVKERSIGVEVFGREASYDTNHDPIVRTTAGEVRKRIAQYYHEPGHETEIRIELPPGSYVPEFFFPPGVSEAPPAAPGLEEPSAVAHSRAAGAPLWLAPKWRAAMWCLTGLVLSLAIVLSGAALERSRLATSRAVLDEFWGPILSSSAPVIVCIGQPPVDTVQASLRQDGQKTVSDFVRTTDHIALSDGMALADLAGFLSKRGKSYRVQGSAATSLTDLRQGAAILIAGFDNSWTMRAIDPLRFHFVHTSSVPDIFSIQDRENPTRNDWSVNYDTPYVRVTEDFAIIARFVDSVSDQTAVVAAGVGENGTISAGEFLTNARFLEQIAARAPRDWAHKNLEAVIVTQVIDEKSGPPRLLAVHFW